MSGSAADEARLDTPAYRRRFLFILFWVCLFDFADRNVFSVTQETIKAEFALTDFQVGVLGGAAFAILFAVVGIPIGRLADRHNRTAIIAACTALWSASTVLCGLAGNFFTMAAGRIGVGLGEAGFMGPTSSLVSDQFPANKRASRMAVILLGTPAGVLLGANLGGWAAQNYDWRLAFLLLGAPGLLAAACVWLFVKEPTRGRMDPSPVARSASRQPGLGAVLREIVAVRPLFWIMLGGSAAGLGMTTISVFLASFLARSHGLPPGQAGTVFGAVQAASISAGFIIGSFGTDWLSRRDARWPAWGAALGLGCAPLLFWAGLSVQSVVAAAILVMAGGTAQASFYGPTIGMIQNLIRPDMRATGTAVFAMLTVLSGYFVGPPAIGLLSDAIAQALFVDGDLHALCPGGAPAPGLAPQVAAACEQATASGLQYAMMCGVSAVFLAAFCYLMAARNMRGGASPAPA